MARSSQLQPWLPHLHVHLVVVLHPPQPPQPKHYDTPTLLHHQEPWLPRPPWREAVATVLSGAILSRLLLAAAETASGECPLEHLDDEHDRQ
jgi:hypothetical protein